MPDPATGADDEAQGQILQRTRSRVRELAVEDGDFHVACRETGVRPEPVTEARFDAFEAAERACEAARRYREALARLDPSASAYDLDVYQTTGQDVTLASVRETTDERRENGLPASRQSVLLAGSGADEWLRMDNGAVVHVVGGGSLLDDEVVSRQLDVKL